MKDINILLYDIKTTFMAIQADKKIQEAEERVNIKMEKMVDEINKIHSTMHGVNQLDQNNINNHQLVLDCQPGFYKKEEITYELDKPIITTICDVCPEGYQCDGKDKYPLGVDKNLTGPDLTSANLVGRDLTGVNWKEANLTGVGN